jgi:hypothetical protein
MILGYHVIFGAYGFWLPNDPRGSRSDFGGAWELYRYGPATKTTETRSLAHQPHDVAARLAAKQALKYPPVQFTGTRRGPSVAASPPTRGSPVSSSGRVPSCRNTSTW